MSSESQSSLNPTTQSDSHPSSASLLTFVDLFAGIGGFHVAAASLGLSCKFASDIDRDACDLYEENFGIRPFGDIAELKADLLPDHDVMFAGLPCQPFSIIGKRRGFADARGNLFFEAARLIEVKRPKAIVIENVKQFATLDGGKPILCVKATLEALGYTVNWRVLNALDFGLPQKRERVLIVALRDANSLEWPEGGVPMRPLDEILEGNPDKSHFASARIRNSRQQQHKAVQKPMIWHENKGGNISSHPFSCALRASASYNYLLVDGERRLTPREMFRLQGFPDSFQLPKTVTAARRLSGNAVPIPLVQAVIKSVLDAFKDR